jgi:hypothetical protein
MPISQPPLLTLRGVFSDPLSDVTRVSPPYPLKDFVDLFPVTDEHVVLVTLNCVHLLRVPSEEVLWSIIVPGPILIAALSSDQHLLALGFYNEVVFWDLDTGQVFQRLGLSLASGDDFLFSPDGTLLAVALFDEGVQLWDWQAGQLMHTLMDEQGTYRSAPKSMAFYPDSTLLAVSHAEGPHIWLYHVPDGALLHMLDEHPWRHRICGLAFSPDGHFLIGSEWSTDPEEESMSIWEMPEGRRIEGIPYMAWLPAISPDGQCVASMDDDSVFLWNLSENRLVWQTHGGGGKRLRWSPGGPLLLSYGSAEACWWRVQDGQIVSLLKHVRVGQVRGVFASQGQRLATRLLSGEVQVSSTATGQVLFHAPYSYPQICGCAMDDTGEQLILWEDGTRPGIQPVHLFDLTRDEEAWRFPLAEALQMTCATCRKADGLVAVGCIDSKTAQTSLLLWVRETQSVEAAEKRPGQRVVTT